MIFSLSLCSEAYLSFLCICHKYDFRIYTIVGYLFFLQNLKTAKTLSIPCSGWPKICLVYFEINFRNFAKRLISNGAAYHCFCTERRLELLRKDARRSRLVPKYDNHCRHLSKKDVLEKQKEGKQSCIRLKVNRLLQILIYFWFVKII